MLTHLVERSPGETRGIVLDDQDRLVRLTLERQAWAGTRALLGQCIQGRVTSVDRARRGAFVDLGLGEQLGFLPVDPQGRARGGEAQVPVREGARLDVLVTREACRGKNAVLALAKGRTPTPEAPPMREVEASVRAHWDMIDQAFEAALSALANLPGGGTLTIEPTAALVAVDVDMGGRRGSDDPARLTFDLNRAAARSVVAELGHRRLGGLVVIDFVTMRDRNHQKEVLEALTGTLKGISGASCGAMSSFGLVEMSLPQRETPLHELLLTRPGGPLSLESRALEALRQAWRAGLSNVRTQLTIEAGAQVLAWLAGPGKAPLDALTARLGPRVVLQPGPTLRADQVRVFEG